MMDGTGRSNAAKNSDSFLKTSTWGALIALSLLAAALGFRGSFSSSRSDSTEQIEARLESPQLPLEQSPAQAAPQSSHSQSQSRPSGPILDQRRTSSALAVNRQVTSTTSSAFSNMTSKLGAQSQPLSSATSSDNQDPQTLIATKIAPDLKAIDPDKPVDIIVQFRHSPSDTELDADGAVTKAEIPLLKARLVTMRGADVANLAMHSNVAYVSPDRKVTGALDHVVAAVNADLARASGWDGTGIGIAIIDSGIHNSPDFQDLSGKNKLVYNFDFAGGGGAAADDLYGHGTHVAGIASSSGKASTCANCTRLLRGIAPNVKLINLRVLNQNGAGTDSMVIAAIQKAISLKSTYNIRVINLSLGRGVYESYTLDPLCQAVEAAWNAGIVVVASAGNMGEYGWPTIDGYSTIGAPGNDPYVITVGATNTHGTGAQTSQTVTSYSSKGPTAIDHIVKPDLVAPGNRVVSDNKMDATLPKAYPANIMLLSYYQSVTNTNLSNQYFMLSGTRMATPVVSGVAALL